MSSTHGESMEFAAIFEPLSEWENKEVVNKDIDVILGKRSNWLDV